MSFYEGCGPSNYVGGFSSTEVIPSEIQAVKRVLNESQYAQIVNMVINSTLPSHIILALSSNLSKYMQESNFKNAYTTDSGTEYENDLPPAVIIANIDQVFKFFDTCNETGELMIDDIKGMSYGIYSFNNTTKNIISLKRNQKAFTAGVGVDAYLIELSYIENMDKHKFGLIINSIGTQVTKIESLQLNKEIKSSLNNYWFPKIDDYFHSDTKKTSLDSFIRRCRQNVRG